MAFVVYEELGAHSGGAVGRVRWWFHVVRWSGVVVRRSSSFPPFGELGGFCGVIGTSVFAFVYIFRSVGGVLSIW